MKSVSNLAIALMLSLGAVAAPAIAKDKPAQGADAPLKVSAEFGKLAGAGDAALTAKDYAAAETQYAAAEAIAKNDDEHFYIASKRLMIAAGKNDSAGVAKALDVLLVNPRTPPAAIVKYSYLRGSIAVDEKQYAQAIPLLLKARQLGSTEPNLPVSLAQAYGGSGNVAAAVAELDKAVSAETAAGRKAPESWYNFAVSNLYKAGDRSGTATWMTRELHEYPNPANWRKMILLYRDSADKAGTKLTRNQKIDMFRLMRTAKALSDQNDYYDYADATLKAGLPWETVSVIDEGRAAGKVSANALSDVYAAGKSAIAGERPLSVYENEAKTGPNGAKAAQTADAYLAARNYAKAAELYGLAGSKGGINADEVNLRLGVALVNLGRKDEAKAAFAKVSGAPLVDIAHFWTLWLDTPQLSG